ncbi:MAG: ABC transporter substrate-binding protein [Erysipelotrichaceae bacterium]
MKKIFILMLALLVSISLVGCGSSKKTAEELGMETEIEFLNFDSESAGKIVQYITGQWDELLSEYGFTFTINPQPFQQKMELTTSGDFSVTLSGWGPDYDWPTTYLDMWASDSLYNDIGYNNEEFDALIDSTDKDEATVWKDLQKAEQILIEDAAFIPLYQRNGVSLQNPLLKDLVYNKSGVNYVYKWAYKTDGSWINTLESAKLPTLDPNKVTDTVSGDNLGNLNEGLVRQGQEPGTFVEGVAKEWSFDEATMTWTFKLRDNANWVDCNDNVVRKVVAQDFADSWARLIDPATASQYADLYNKAKISEVNVISDTELQVVVSENVPYFLSIIAFGSFLPINKEFVDAQNGNYGSTKETSLYNGSFFLSKWEHASSVQWTKSENYWDKASVKAPGVNIRVIEKYETATGVQLYENGDIDRVGLSGEFVAQYESDPNKIIVEGTSVFYLLLNVANGGISDTITLDETFGHPLFDNVNIRKALALSFDKTFVSDDILKNGSFPADYFVPSDYIANKDGEAFESVRGDGYMIYDMDAAFEYLEKGMDELGIAKVS